jgi:RNA polymerase sigma-70 factor (ECF subfamily)
MRDFPRQKIQDFRQGDKAAFDELYAAFAPWLYGICMRYTRCASDAQDVLQEIFIKVFQSKKQLDPEKDIAPWLKTIAIRVALNYIRDQYKYVPQGDEDFRDDDAEETEHDMSFLRDRRDLLLKALQQLPEGYRLVFSLYAVDNLTHKEIAAYLGIAEGTSKSQYAKAKMNLKQILESSKLPA